MDLWPFRLGRSRQGDGAPESEPDVDPLPPRGGYLYARELAQQREADPLPPRRNGSQPPRREPSIKPAEQESAAVANKPRRRQRGRVDRPFIRYPEPRSAAQSAPATPPRTVTPRNAAPAAAPAPASTPRPEPTAFAPRPEPAASPPASAARLEPAAPAAAPTPPTQEPAAGRKPEARHEHDPAAPARVEAESPAQPAPQAADDAAVASAAAPERATADRVTPADTEQPAAPLPERPRRALPPDPPPEPRIEFTYPGTYEPVSGAQAYRRRDERLPPRNREPIPQRQESWRHDGMTADMRGDRERPPADEPSRRVGQAEVDRREPGIDAAARAREEPALRAHEARDIRDAEAWRSRTPAADELWTATPRARAWDQDFEIRIDQPRIPDDDRRAPPPRHRERARTPSALWVWPLLIVLAGATGFAVYRSGLHQDQAPQAVAAPHRVFDRPGETPVASAAGVTAAPAIRHPIPAAGAEPEAALPPLERSDRAMSELVRTLVGGNAFKALVQPQQLVRHIVATVDNLPRRMAPMKMRPFKPAPGPFVPNASNVRRYARYVRAVEALDASLLVQSYARFYPLFQRAYEDLGFPGRYFNDRLIDVIDHLLLAPELAGPVELIRPKVLYQYADLQLEARSAGQKFMMRMGRDNARRVKAKLREIRAELAKLSLDGAGTAVSAPPAKPVIDAAR